MSENHATPEQRTDGTRQTEPAPARPAVTARDGSSVRPAPHTGPVQRRPVSPSAETAETADAAETAGTAADLPEDTTAPATTTQRRPRVPRFPEGPAIDPAGAHHERRIRSFRPRRGRVTVGQGEALRRLWPRWGLDIDGRRRIDLGELFGDPDLPVVLEIGFGMGEATAWMAEADPDTGILAADVHTPGQGNLLWLAERNGLSNVRVANGDAVILLREMLAPASLAGLRLYFPDPWPKKRHHKRRLVQPEFLALAADRLRTGATLHCATDWEPYAEQMLEALDASSDFENTDPDNGFAARPEFRPLTKFESQGLGKGHRVHDLLFRRR